MLKILLTVKDVLLLLRIKASNQIKTLSHREEKSLISRFFNEIQSNNDNDCFVNKIKSTNLWRRLECKNTIS